MTDGVSSKEKIIAYLKLGKSNKEIAELCSVSVRTVERHKKALMTNDSDTKNDKRQNRKVAKEMAKILVEEGHTLKEASEQSSVNIRTLERYSAKENWIQSQKEFSQKIYSELQSKHLEEHIQRKKKVLEYLDFITEKSIEKLKDDEITVDKAVNTIIISIKGQSEILGIQDIKSIIEVEELEIKKNKDKKPDTLDKVGNFLKKLDRFL